MIFSLVLALFCQGYCITACLSALKLFSFMLHKLSIAYITKSYKGHLFKHLYADDCQIYSTGRTFIRSRCCYTEKINADLKIISTWSSNNRLPIKTPENPMLFSSRKVINQSNFQKLCLMVKQFNSSKVQKI